MESTVCPLNLHTVEVKQVGAINSEDVKEKGVPLALLRPYEVQKCPRF